MLKYQQICGIILKANFFAFSTIHHLKFSNKLKNIIRGLVPMEKNGINKTAIIIALIIAIAAICIAMIICGETVIAFLTVTVVCCIGYLLVQFNTKK